MNDPEAHSRAVISNLTANLPLPIEASFLKAIGALLGGLTAIPAAWVRRPSQAANDITTGRSAVAAILANGVAKQALQDPNVMQAASEIYLPTSVRKARNRVMVAQRAAEHTADTEQNGPQAAPLDDDWMNAFVRFAEDASSEQLQDLFGRILAGQMVRPGSFALSTLRAVAELDQPTAEDFSLVWTKSVGEAVDYSAEFQRGDWFARWMRLVEVGLMAATNTAQFLPPYNPSSDGTSLWTPMAVGDTFLNVHFSQSCGAQWIHIDFTRTGRQIGSILAPPDYEANMREAGLKFSQEGVARVELHSAGKPVELIFAAPVN